MTSCSRVVLIGMTALFVASASAWAIQPGQWVHTTEADFEPGEREHTVVTNLGDVQLARQSEKLGELPDEVGIVYDVWLVNGELWLAAGPEARLLVRRDEEIHEIASLPSEQIFTLAVFDGKLLVAISGQTSRLAVVQDDELITLVELEDVRYIWDIVVDGEVIYLATGLEGKVLAVEPALFDAEADENPGLSVVLEAQQPNILCLGRDAQGRLYAGTDQDGLVFRLARNDDGEWDAFVMYDAPEPEIGALLVRADGTVFAGTADANQARPGRLEAAAGQEAGRPETPQPQPSIEVPPAEPEPGDGEPPELPVPPEAEPIEDAAPSVEVEADAPAVESEGEIEAPDSPEIEPPVIDLVRELAMLQEAETAMPQVTAEQRDQLREAIRRRLMEARQSGTLQVQPSRPTARPAPTARPSAPPTRAQPSTPRKPGNAVYRIDAQGFVTEIFRESVMMLRIIEHDGRLLVATGNEGQLFRIDPAAQETTVVIDLEVEQLPALYIGEDQLLLGTANPASLLRIAPQLAPRGTYTSVVLDAAQVSLWGKLNLTARIPDGAQLLVQTRSGNVEDPQRGPWSPWSEPQTLSHSANVHDQHPRELNIASPPARFLQYRLTLVRDDGASPVVDRVALAYVMPNLPPVVTSLQASYGDTPPARPGARPSPAQAAAAGGLPEPKTELKITWEASDPNNDRLRYKLEYQPSGSSNWLPIKDDIEQNNFDWDTRHVPDGWYTLRLTASDHLDNPADMARATVRRSAPVLVDNTPPTVEYALPRPERAGEVFIEVTAEDEHSIIRSARYAVNATEEWKPMLPDDLIFDSTRERMHITISNLAPGPHVVVLSVSDALGNTAYRHVFVEVK